MSELNKSRPEKLSRIPSDPPKSQAFKLDKNWRKSNSPGKTIYNYALNMSGENSTLPKNPALGLDKYKPQNPNLPIKSLREYLQEYNSQKHFMPIFVPHQLMHWWENHFASAFVYDESLVMRYEGFHDILLLILSLPEKKSENEKILKFILKHIQKKVDLYLDKILLGEVPVYRELSFDNSCMFLLCFQVILTNVVGEICQKNNLDVQLKIEEKNAQMLRKLQYRFGQKEDLTVQKHEKENTVYYKNLQNYLDLTLQKFWQHILPSNLYESKIAKKTEFDQNFNAPEIRQRDYQTDATIVPEFWEEMEKAGKLDAFLQRVKQELNLKILPVLPEVDPNLSSREIAVLRLQRQLGRQ